jgi:single-strand DNA-binding protein
MNCIVLVGRLGQDPEMKYTPGGKAVCNVSLATNDGKDQVNWHSLVAWDKVAEVLVKYVKKGHMVAVQGTLVYDKWEDKETSKPREKAKINVFRVSLIQSKKEAEQAEQSAPAGDDSLPF